MDLVRSGGDLIKADILESLELLLARAGLIEGGQVVDADIVVLGINAESDQDVKLELSSPSWDATGTRGGARPGSLEMARR